MTTKRNQGQVSGSNLAKRSEQLARKIQFMIALIIIDIAAYTLSFVLAVWIRKILGTHLSALPAIENDTMRFADLYFMPLMFVTVFFYERLYQRRVPFLDEVRDIAKSITILTVFLFALISLGHMAHLVSRLAILIMAPISIIIVASFRYWGKLILYRFGFGTQNLIVVGEPSAAVKFKRELMQERTLGYSYCGFVPVSSSTIATRIESTELNPIGKIAEVPNLVRDRRIECILIAAPASDQSKIQQLVSLMHRHVEHVLLIPEMRSGAMLNSELYHLFVNQLFLLKMRNSLREASARFTKMLFDYLMVLISLPVSLPFILLIALSIKLTSRGPILYTQLRVGQHGRTFRMYKFRSMFADAESRLKSLLENNQSARQEWKNFHKLQNDPRVTRLGSFIRKTSIDELPQLINVILGDMSLVGPRPVPFDEFHQRYDGKSEYYCLVRPGMTGLWQISGRSSITFAQRIEMDTWYVFNWSLYIDLVILYKTIGVVLKRRGAY